MAFSQHSLQNSTLILLQSRYEALNLFQSLLAFQLTLLADDRFATLLCQLSIEIVGFAVTVTG
jgi:hypothetical protein